MDRPSLHSPERTDRSRLLHLVQVYLLVASAAYIFSIALAVIRTWYRVDLVILGAFVSISYGIVLYLSLTEPRLQSTPGIVFITFAYSTLLGLVYVVLFVIQTGVPFAPNAVDTIFYHVTALELRDSSFTAAARDFLAENEVDDLGVILYPLLLYKLLPSPLVVYFANILLGSVSAGLLYRLLRRYATRQTSAFFALLFSTSSFAVFLRVSHFKESLLVFLTLLAFRRLERLGKAVTWSILLELLVIAVVIYFLRPVLALFILFGLFIWVLFTYRSTLLFRVGLLVAGVGAFVFLAPQLEAYIRRSFVLDPQKMFSVSQAAEVGYESIGLSFLASFFSVLFGPIPSILAVRGREVSAFYGPGLLFRYLLSIPALFGVVHVIKKRQKELYPLLTFLFLEALSLAVILRGFDLRFAYPHFPILYLLAAIQLTRTDFRVGDKTLVMAVSTLLLIVAFWFNARLEMLSLQY